MNILESIFLNLEPAYNAKATKIKEKEEKKLSVGKLRLRFVLRVYYHNEINEIFDVLNEFEELTYLAVKLIGADVSP